MQDDEHDIEELTSDLARLRIAFVNVYFAGAQRKRTATPWVLVDAGLSFGAAQILGIAAERYGPEVKPSAVVLTHGHFDHVGALDALLGVWDVPVYAHTLELPFLTGRSDYPPPDPTVGRGLVARLSPAFPERGAALRLMPMSFKNSPFRYRHALFAPAPGALYTADEMCDDLNSDKFLDACRNARHNHLYRWLSDPEEGRRPRAVRPRRLRDALEVARLAALAQAPHGLTDAQRSVVGEHLTDRVLVVQGPPGTGKSHTLGFAIISRMLAQATPARPFRVAVLARTHAAVSVALDSVAKRAAQLLAKGEGGGTTDEGDAARPSPSTQAPSARSSAAQEARIVGRRVNRTT